MPNTLRKHREIWKKKKIIREVYTVWYKKILKDLKQGTGKTIELGAGSGNFKQFKPDVISSDIEKCEWLDMCFDAHDMPFKNKSISNLVLIDVLHHLASPIKFLKEAARVLEKGGRIVFVEPYPSVFSLIVYRKFHPEPFLMDVDYFKKKSVEDKEPWDSNQAIAYLLFFKYRNRFLKEFGKDFEIKKIHLMSLILYPASGGFENKAMIPDFLIPSFKLFELILTPFQKLLAFRCYIVLEKQ